MTVSKLFVDTAPIIYILDNHPVFHKISQDIIRKNFIAKTEFITSILTFMEYAVKPKQMNDKKAEDNFKNFLFAIGCKILPITLEIADIGAEIRAKYSGIKPFDAIQIATAIYNNCDAFVTNDKQLKQIKEINILVLSEIEN